MNNAIRFIRAKSTDKTNLTLSDTRSDKINCNVHEMLTFNNILRNRDNPQIS